MLKTAERRESNSVAKIDAYVELIADWSPLTELCSHQTVSLSMNPFDRLSDDVHLRIFARLAAELIPTLCLVSRRWLRICTANADALPRISATHLALSLAHQTPIEQWTTPEQWFTWASSPVEWRLSRVKKNGDEEPLCTFSALSHFLIDVCARHLIFRGAVSFCAFIPPIVDQFPPLLALPQRFRPRSIAFCQADMIDVDEKWLQCMVQSLRPTVVAFDRPFRIERLTHRILDLIDMVDSLTLNCPLTVDLHDGIYVNHLTSLIQKWAMSPPRNCRLTLGEFLGEGLAKNIVTRLPSLLQNLGLTVTFAHRRPGINVAHPTDRGRSRHVFNIYYSC